MAVTAATRARDRGIAGVATGLLIGGVAAASGAWVAVLLLARADGLATPAYDQAFFQQLIWRLGHDGRWLTSFDDGSFLGLHFSPLLAVPAALERVLWQDARLLSLLHAGAVASLAPATYLLLRSALRPSALAGTVALGLAIPTPIWAVTQEVVRADFHPELAGVALALVAGWGFLSHRAVWPWIVAGLALAAREDVSYAVFAVGLGVWALGRGRARRRGLVLAAVATAWGALVFGLVMPLLRDGAVVDTARYYAWLGPGPEALFAIVRMPEEIAAALTRQPAWYVFAGLVVSLAGLPLLRPRWLVLLVPPMVAVLLSRHPPQALLQLQYPAILIAPAIVAAALGARRALAVLGRRHRRLRPVAPLVSVGLAAPALVVAILQGAVPPFDAPAGAAYARPPAIAELRAVAATVPADGRLAVETGSAPPLASRGEIDILVGPYGVFRDAYVLLDADAWSPNAVAAERRQQLVERILGQDRRVLASDGRFTLLGPVDVDAP